MRNKNNKEVLVTKIHDYVLSHILTHLHKGNVMSMLSVLNQLINLNEICYQQVFAAGCFTENWVCNLVKTVTIIQPCHIVKYFCTFSYYTNLCYFSIEW